MKTVIKERFFPFPALVLATFFFFSTGCFNNVSYIDKGKFIKPNIWEKPLIDADELSGAQKKIYGELGSPTYILVYREAVSGREKPRKVEEWVYEKRDKFLWFVEGKLTDEIPVQVPGLRKSIFSRDEQQGPP